jgi:hypothetical protein
METPAETEWQLLLGVSEEASVNRLEVAPTKQWEKEMGQQEDSETTEPEFHRRYPARRYRRCHSHREILPTLR